MTKRDFGLLLNQLLTFVRRHPSPASVLNFGAMMRGFFVLGGAKGPMRKTIKLGILFSRSGSYGSLSSASRRGALLAIDAINSDESYDFVFETVERDPKGNVDLYAPLCKEILEEKSVAHVIGCVTSWSRKDVIPLLERYGATLWYCLPYEGFEASDHVVYTHACPNQHLLPLLSWALPRFGNRGYLTGSNYIWGWEVNRVAREIILEAGGDVLGERYLALDDVSIGHMIEEIQATRPNFVLNSLVGASSYTFLKAFAELAKTDSFFTPDNCPVLSCNLTESEFVEIGAAAEGLISAGPYFHGARGWPCHGVRSFESSFEAASWAAVMELAKLLQANPGAESAPISKLLSVNTHRTMVDTETHHTALPVLIAQVKDGAFQVLEQWQDIPADPYLSHSERRTDTRLPRLQIVK
ncbi:transporter substrate-binding protein [Leisingera sp. SS27]|uniref:transporter substrate-binding protein n=1 Tax=Leisingera sp. SS27 TaxID=2979462 RepID=UPI00232EC136|nr:transporter substrate-binding protein [Leisingera sp. SS27]MDC0657799.1 transporter substrate-binding protein [Leisingera sp. SS27]